MGLLGQGRYEALVQGRGGSPLLAAANWQDITFSRRLDDLSSATVRCAGPLGAGGLGLVKAWKHELTIFRDREEAWVGPVITPTWERDVVEIQANDLFFWFERRLLDLHDHQFVATDLGQIFGFLAADALERDNSMGISIVTSNTGVRADRTIHANERKRAADVLRELSRTAVDFTAIGRTIHCGGLEVQASPFWLNDDTLRSPKLAASGTDAASEVVVMGANVSGAAVVGVAGSGTGDVGLVQLTASEPTIEDTFSASVAAGTRLEFAGTPPESLTGILSAQAPVDFAELVPGAIVHVELSSLARPVNDDFRLTQVDVRVGASQQGLEEEIAVTLEPVGTIKE